MEAKSMKSSSHPDLQLRASFALVPFIRADIGSIRTGQHAQPTEHRFGYLTELDPLPSFPKWSRSGAINSRFFNRVLG